jgi:hypothetical protein
MVVIYNNSAKYITSGIFVDNNDSNPDGKTITNFHNKRKDIISVESILSKSKIVIFFEEGNFSCEFS